MSEKLSSSAEERNRERQSRCEGKKGGKERIDHLEKREARKREASPPGECERVASLSSREARSIRDTESEREREKHELSRRVHGVARIRRRRALKSLVAGHQHSRK